MKGSDMEISFIDKSNYLKGLLIVAKKNKKLAESEKKIIRAIAERLGFAPDFYEEILRNLVANKYITEEPILFSDLRVASSFIADGVKIAYSDDQISENEFEWLKKTAELNDVKDAFEEEMKKYAATSSLLLNTEFALLSILG
jgi:uncharacterized tellurite resistance protein B-like protein